MARNVRAAAIIVAAGSGRRFGRPKAFVSLAGRPMLAWSLASCGKAPGVGPVIVVVRREDLVRARRLASGFRRVAAVVIGGATRRESVAAGLAAVSPAVRWILVHDAARPLAGSALFGAVLRAARRTGAAVPALPVADTLKRAHGRLVTGTVSRDGLWAVQTPQGFQRSLLEQAHAHARAAGAGASRPTSDTDDAMLVERLGARVALIPGPRTNLKITDPEDRAIADALLRHRV